VRTTEQIRIADAMGDALRANQPRPQPQAAPLSLPQRLSYLDAPRQAGQITQDEYDPQRAAIIGTRGLGQGPTQAYPSPPAETES
jgi:hypothetical protein